MNPFRAFYDRLPVQTRITIRRLLPGSIRHWYAQHNTDAYLISYPKCGRTWLRLMIGRAIASYVQRPDDEDILLLQWKNRLKPGIPRIAVVHDNRPMLKAPEELETSKLHYRGKKVIFLVRDPRDVIVSSYFEMTRRGQIFGENPYEQRQAVFEGSLSDFIAQRQGGFATILRYYTIWAENRHIPEDFLLVRYEDMKADPQRELRRVLDFLGLQAIPQKLVSEAVAYASFENMRRMEVDGKFQHGMLKPGDRSNQESFKTRKGKVKGYIDYLSSAEIQALNDKMANDLPAYFGYSQSTGAGNPPDLEIISSGRETSPVQQ
jgi:hypothetical protein